MSTDPSSVDDAMISPVEPSAAVDASPKNAPAARSAAKAWWFDALVLIWPLVVAAGVVHYTGERAKEVAAEAVKAPPRVVVIDELALIQMVVREERLQDIDSVRRRVSEVVKPYTDNGYIVIGDMNIVDAPGSLKLTRADLEALYARSKR